MNSRCYSVILVGNFGKIIPRLSREVPHPFCSFLDHCLVLVLRKRVKQNSSRFDIGELRFWLCEVGGIFAHSTASSSGTAWFAEFQDQFVVEYFNINYKNKSATKFNKLFFFIFQCNIY